MFYIADMDKMEILHLDKRIYAPNTGNFALLVIWIMQLVSP
jgi:hypothetical protein